MTRPRSIWIVKVAVIGAGISGFAAAWALHGAGHEVVLYERDRQAGGHTATVDVDSPAGAIPVDTGFIVYNERTYPRFLALLAELGVETQPSDMSFATDCRTCRVAYSSRGARGFFPDLRTLARPSQWRMLFDVRRFYAAARAVLADPTPTGLTLGDWLEREGFGDDFQAHFIVPITSAVWSTGSTRSTDFPVDYLLRFLDNHGLIGLGNAPQWRVVRGGSRTYVEKLLERLPPGTLRAAHPVVAVTRGADGARVRTDDGAEVGFDGVVIASHADDALRMLADADTREREVLGAFDYSVNDVVLHTDERVLSANPRARASWNVHVPDCRAAQAAVTMTYDMSRLQSIPGSTRYLVTLNARDRIDPATVILARPMSHPTYTFRTLGAQRDIAGIQGRNRTWYAGAHLGYGFHEDGCRAGQLAAEMVDLFARGPAASQSRGPRA